MKSRDLQTRLLYPAKIAFRIEEQIKSFADKKRLKEFIIIKPLYKMIKGLKKKKKKKIKTMNNKMAKIHIYQQLNLKNNLSKQKEQRQDHGYGECFDG